MGAIEGDIITILTGIGMVLALVFVFVWYMIRRKRRIEDDLIASRAQDLQRLERKAALTPEEKKKIREAMARQYLAEQDAKAEAGQMPKGVHDLMIEAERIDMELQRKREAGELPAPRKAVPDVEPDETASSHLPEHLRPLAKKSREELEDLRNAGFITNTDYHLLREMAAESE